MALYRLHKKEWDKNFSPAPRQKFKGKKRERDTDSLDSPHQGSGKKSRKEETFPGGGRRGVSSGLSTVVKQSSVSAKNLLDTMGAKVAEGDWWSTLNGVGSSKEGSKGTFKW